MPRTSIQHPPKYSKHKATGRAYVTLNGQAHYLGKHGSPASKQAYESLITQWVQGGGRYLPNAQDEITVVEVMTAYLAHAKRYYRKNGKQTRESGHAVEICRAIRKIYGKSLAKDFGPLALKTVRQTFVDDGIARRHINKQVDRIKRMFKWAAAEELIASDIPQALSMVAGLRAGRTEAPDRAPILPVQDDVIEATLEHLPSIVADMVRFQRATGCRPEEACSIRPCELDRTGDVWVYKPTSHKTQHHGRQRAIFIGPNAQAVLLRYLARDAEAYCFRPCDSEEKRRSVAESERVTPTKYGNAKGTNRVRNPKRKAGERYSTDSYRRSIHRACDKAGVDRWSPNRLRHSAATEIRKRFGLEAAQVTLGHASADITQVYAERDNTLAIEVAAKIGWLSEKRGHQVDGNERGRMVASTNTLEIW